ncbi:MAG: hypothetical protein PUC71_02230 [Oscillospiraceae bacterium]|nr:hypothetical protein [Oscillospiraceae bacterium]
MRIRRILAWVLAAILTAAICTPAASAAEKSRESSGEQATLGELIALDRELIQNIYTATAEVNRRSLVPEFRAQPETWALAAALAAQRALIGAAAWEEAENVITALRRGVEPTPAQEEIRIVLKRFDFQLLHNALINSLPPHWAEVTRPTPAMQAQLAKTGGQTVPGRTFFDLSPNYFNSQRRSFDRDTSAVFYPLAFVHVGDYAMVYFEVEYTGDSSYTIDGFEQFELRAKDGSTVYAGGYVGDSTYFRGPIRLNKGEAAYFGIVFDPGTWYDLNMEDLYTGSDTSVSCLAVLTNRHAEA